MTELILFTQETCGACAVQKEQNDGIEETFPDIEVREVDIRADMETATEYGVRKTPTTLIYADGKQINEFIGVVSKEDLEDALRVARS